MSLIPISSLVQRTLYPITENGREYLRDWLDIYPFPVDEKEQKRAEIIHALQLAAFGSPLQAVLPPNPSKQYLILDVGSGSDDWCIEIAVMRPDFLVLGVDIHGGANLQLPNFYRVRGFNFEENWSLQPHSLDLVRCSMLAGCVSDWALLFERARTVLKPGGQLEIVEIDWRPRSDGPLPAESFYVRWYQEIAEASRLFGKPIDGVIERTMENLQKTGFRVTRHRSERLGPQAASLQCTLSAEADDACLRMGRLMDLLLTEENGGHLEGMSMRLLTQRGWRPAEVRSLCRQARTEARQKDFPLHHRM